MDYQPLDYHQPLREVPQEGLGKSLTSIICSALCLLLIGLFWLRVLSGLHQPAGRSSLPNWLSDFTMNAAPLIPLLALAACVGGFTRRPSQRRLGRPAMICAIVALLAILPLVVLVVVFAFSIHS